MKEDDGNPSTNYNLKKMWNYLCTHEETMKVATIFNYPEYINR
jgi:hypothetical protein